MGKKYELTYNDVKNVAHKLEIYDDSFSGVVQDDLVGRVYLDGQSVDNVLEPIQGSSLRVELDATTARDFSDIYLGAERAFLCVYSIAGSVEFQGWMNPEGWWESLNDDTWRISFDVIDGLGYLEGLSYVQSDGLFWNGKQSGLEVVKNCLARTELDMNIHTNIGIRYTGLSGSVDSLANAKFNSERFYQDDSEEPMSCQEVLKSTLEVFGAVIKQRKGEWIIYRPNELAVSASATYYGYDSDAVALSPATSVIDLAETVGSEGTGTFSNVYVNRNQRLSNLRPLGGFALNYKYGLASSLLGSNKYLYTADGTTYADWTLSNTTNLNLYGAGSQSIGFKAVAIGSKVIQMTSSATVSLVVNDMVQLRMTAAHSVYPYTVSNTFYYRVKAVGANTYYLKQNGDWGAAGVIETMSTIFYGITEGEIRISSQPLLEAANVTVELYSLESLTLTGGLNLRAVELVLNNDNIGAIKGEIHTAQRTDNPSSKIIDPEDVFVGDNYEDTYVGAIYKADGSTNTDEWTRDKVAETKPLLQIAVEDRLRMANEVRRVFSGDVFGFIPNLGVYTLEGITGKFIPIKYNYDCMNSVTNVEMHEILDDELTDIDYTQTKDYGSTVKPKIRG